MLLNEQVYNIKTLRLEKYFSELLRRRNIKENLINIVEYTRDTYKFKKFNFIVSTSSLKNFDLMSIHFNPVDMLRIASHVYRVMEDPAGITDADLIARDKELKEMEVSIFVDSKVLFNEYDVKFTPRELVAIFLHEIGHILRFPSYIFQAAQEAKKILDERPFLKAMTRTKLTTILILPLLNRIFSDPKYLEELNSMNQSEADRWALQNGYAQEIHSSMKKVKLLSKELKVKLGESVSHRLKEIEKITREEIKQTEDPEIRAYLQSQLKKM